MSPTSGGVGTTKKFYREAAEAAPKSWSILGESGSDICSNGQSAARPMRCADPMRASPIRPEAGRYRVG